MNVLNVLKSLGTARKLLDERASRSICRPLCLLALMAVVFAFQTVGQAQTSTQVPSPAVGYYAGSTTDGTDSYAGVVYVSKDKSQFWLQGIYTNLTTGRKSLLQGRYSPNHLNAPLTSFTISDRALLNATGKYTSASRTFHISFDLNKRKSHDLVFITDSRATLKKILKLWEDKYSQEIYLPEERVEGGKSDPASIKKNNSDSQSAVKASPATATAATTITGLVGTDSWALIREELMEQDVIDHTRKHTEKELAGEFSGHIGYFRAHHMKNIYREWEQHGNGTYYRQKDITYDVTFSPAPAVLKQGEIYTFVVQAIADMPNIQNGGECVGGWQWGPLTVIDGVSSNTDPRHPGLWVGRDNEGFVPFCRYTARVKLNNAPDEFQFYESILSSAKQGPATLIRYTYRKNAVPIRANQPWGGAAFVARQGATSYSLKGGIYQNLPNLDSVNGLGIGDRVKTGANGQIVLRTTSGALVAIEPNSEIEILDGGMVSVISGKKTIISGPGP